MAQSGWNKSDHQDHQGLLSGCCLGYDTIKDLNVLEGLNAKGYSLGWKGEHGGYYQGYLP